MADDLTMSAAADADENDLHEVGMNADAYLHHERQQNPLSRCLPRWNYEGPDPSKRQQLQEDGNFALPALDGDFSIDIGNYSRKNHVTNVNHNLVARRYFDLGLRLMLSYQHEAAAKHFLSCLLYAPHCALAHGFVALCHSPNYNFKGEAYYESANHPEDVNKPDLFCVFPSRQVADRHSKLAVDIVDDLRKLQNSKNEKASASRESINDNCTSISNEPDMISGVESQLLAAIRILTRLPSVENVGLSYANNMRKLYAKYQNDPEVAYCFAESLMVLNAWQLYEYPSGRPSPNVTEIKNVLERALDLHPEHAGLCHMYVHLSEMSSTPALALRACQPLRNKFPHAGHLIHMPTHIDVLLGDYESCVRYNIAAIAADSHVMRVSPATAGKETFYFGYIVHNYHMAVYGAILGAMEGKAMSIAFQLNEFVNEDTFKEFPDLASYLEAYSALEIMVMIRFGRWEALLEVEFPEDKKLMLYRAAAIYFGRGLAQASLGNIAEAYREAENFEALRRLPDAETRIMHNNSVAQLLKIDSSMLQGEIAYREKKYEDAFRLLRAAVNEQDNLNYDEPWGKMQPIRHTLGGLLLEQGHIKEANECFRRDLCLHPKNPWALVGLIGCLKKNISCCSSSSSSHSVTESATVELAELTDQLREAKRGEWVDYNVTVACECCHLSLQ